MCNGQKERTIYLINFASVRKNISIGSILPEMFCKKDVPNPIQDGYFQGRSRMRVGGKKAPPP